MDPAEESDLQNLLSNSNACLDWQEEQMLATGWAVQTLVAQVSELTTQVQLLRSPTAPPTTPVPPRPTVDVPHSEPCLPTPERYGGEPKMCRAF